ncbi:MAG: redoxin family protein [Deltaproteobacteria bacterium]|nr:redoxin family protein [Deltaproteobacteria bacterium]
MTIRSGAKLPDALLACEVARAEGGTVTLGELVRGQVTLLLFVRQFGCAGCSQRLTELVRYLKALRAAGVNVVVVGCGSADDARGFRDRFALDARPVTVVTDPSLAAQRAAGLHRSHWGVLGAKGTYNLLRAMANGHRNAWGKGDFYQLGGTILVGRDGVVALHHEERHLGESLVMGDVSEKALAMFATQSERETGVRVP